MSASMLHPGNEAVRQRLSAALEALFRLNLLGVVVRRIDIGARNPVLEIDPPPPGVLFGSLARKVYGSPNVVMASHVLGCQVEWQVLVDIATAVQEARTAVLQ